ncbi:stalk domain-containing protein [Paenibacillus protaetiae]|uniref:Copper amine oxidase n=1 Tax=Paenibacillus protaetiae TaxID=2509456 RepID=A0A4P6EYF1_9BACL|nr:stalk domain-containing protein [Paenibacillus protaetiae]QAY67745.1 copper amine oxidase [Paenibacillus protaetiae]
MRLKKKNKGRQAKRLAVKTAIVMLGGTLAIQPAGAVMPAGWSPVHIHAAAAAAAANTLKEVSESIVTSGAKRIDYLWTATRSGKTATSNVHVIEVDLSNPNVKLDAISGKNSTVGTLNTVQNMVKESGAVAGINADVFNTTTEGAPMGPQITNGVLMSTPEQLSGMYAFGISNSRVPSVDSYSFKGTVTAQDGTAYQLAGMNQSSYSPEGGSSVYSHVDAAYIYTSAWGGAQRPKNSATTPTEVLVRNGVIEKISIDAPLADTPPADGYILRTHGKAADFVKSHLQVGQTIQSDYTLVSNTTGKNVDPNSFQMLVGGHTILVNNGAAAAFSRDITGVSGSSYVSRSAVGYSKDGKKVYLITTEKYGNSTGVNLKELQDIMVKLGVYKGMNLDGGGSTTMVERPLAETSLTLSHSTQYDTTQRSVSNGIGVFSTAPQGQLKGMKVSGANVLLLGTTASYTAKGYDNYYNPYTVDSAAASWSVTSGSIGTFSGNTLTATKAGSGTITVKSGSVTSTYNVEVVGKDQIASLKIDTAAGVLASGAQVSVPITVTLKDGKTYKLSGNSVKWEFIGFTATQKDNTLTVNTVNDGTKTGYAIARYDGYPTMIPLTPGQSETVFEDFENPNYLISGQVTPDTTLGGVKLVTGLGGQTTGKSLQISYDFTAGTGTKASYAVFNTNGRTVGGSPSSMTMDIYGDKSLNWLRAEFIDNAGKSYLVDLAKQIDWSGWKNVKADLSSLGMSYPVKLKRIYVVTTGDGQDERAASGSIGIDNIKMQFPVNVPAAPSTQIVMNIGNKAATVGGKAYTLDVAPVEMQGTTYVPIRFISEAMGGIVKWEQSLSRVTVLRGSTMLEMNIGKKEMNVNGKVSATSVAPIIQNNRTLIPIRLVSENLGLKVDYEAKTRKVTIS